MNPLLALETSILEEGREWTRQQLQVRLQRAADALPVMCPHSGQPLRALRTVTLPLKTPVGEIQLHVPYGQSPVTRQWHNPVRQTWKLAPHQRTSPELARRLTQTAPWINSYEKAAHVATTWGCPISDDLVRDTVQRVGAQIEATTFAPPLPPPQERPFTLVIMMDGWMVRERGPDWGARSQKHGLERVAWHEVKSAVIYRLEQRAETPGGRGFLIEKFVVACEPQTAPVDFGAAVQAEARRRGLGRAERVLIVIDGAVWLWHVAADRFAQATLELDFHHASQHLWAIAHQLFGEGTPEADAWVRPLLRRLKHGGEARVLQTLEALLTDGQEPVHERVQTEVAYFQTHREHLHYQRIRQQGGPNGSGAMESLCSAFQDRLQRTGQFWSRAGLRHLLGVDVAVRNQDFDALWN
jgi:hypothetical protein